MPDIQNGIIVHMIPFYEDNRPQAQKRRKRWVDFVKLKRAKWEPTKNSAICSAHFKPDDFERKFTSLPGQTKPMQPRLKKDKLWVMAFPSVQAIGRVIDHPQSDRSKRKVR